MLFHCFSQESHLGSPRKKKHLFPEEKGFVLLFTYTFLFSQYVQKQLVCEHQMSKAMMEERVMNAVKPSHIAKVRHMTCCAVLFHITTD